MSSIRVKITENNELKVSINFVSLKYETVVIVSVFSMVC